MLRRGCLRERWGWKDGTGIKATADVNLVTFQLYALAHKAQQLKKQKQVFSFINTFRIKQHDILSCTPLDTLNPSQGLPSQKNLHHTLSDNRNKNKLEFLYFMHYLRIICLKDGLFILLSSELSSTDHAGYRAILLFGYRFTRARKARRKRSSLTSLWSKRRRWSRRTFSTCVSSKRLEGWGLQRLSWQQLWRYMLSRPSLFLYPSNWTTDVYWLISAC